MGRIAREGPRDENARAGVRGDDAREASIACARGLKIHACVCRGVFARACARPRVGGRDATTDAIARAEGRARVECARE